MTSEEAIRFLVKDIEQRGDCFISDALEMAIQAIQALEQEPCEDAISRQAAIDINHKHHGEMPNYINHQIWQELKDLPPVIP